MVFLHKLRQHPIISVQLVATDHQFPETGVLPEHIKYDGAGFRRDFVVAQIQAAQFEALMEFADEIHQVADAFVPDLVVADVQLDDLVLFQDLSDALNGLLAQIIVAQVEAADSFVYPEAKADIAQPFEIELRCGNVQDLQCIVML